MGDREWGDKFADWLTGLPTGIKFVVALGLALGAIVPAALIVSVVDPLLRDPNRSNEISITCGDRSITINMDDSIFDENNLEASAMRMCDRAWGRS